MACRSAGRAINIFVALVMVSQMACGYLGPSKPLRPKLLFSVGSAYLEDVSTVALKGRIEFENGRKSESGKFTMFLRGTDSASFLIEGPLNIDVFKMVILGQDAFVTNPESPNGWQALDRNARVEIAEYGIENISPFLTGLFVFPQYYFVSDPFAKENEGSFSWDDITLKYYQSENEKQFVIKQSDADLFAIYSGRKDVPGGYYPSRVEITDSQRRWQIAIRITAMRVNAAVPDQVWDRD